MEGEPSHPDYCSNHPAQKMKPQSYLPKAIAGVSSEDLRVSGQIPKVKKGQPWSRRPQEVRDTRPCFLRESALLSSPPHLQHPQSNPCAPQTAPGKDAEDTPLLCPHEGAPFLNPNEGPRPPPRVPFSNTTLPITPNYTM